MNSVYDSMTGKDRKVVDYKVISPGEVVNHLSEGWELYGSPVFSEWSKSIRQAVVKYAETEHIKLPVKD
jgi:hypothetical protein